MHKLSVFVESQQIVLLNESIRIILSYSRNFKHFKTIFSGNFNFKIDVAARTPVQLGLIAIPSHEQILLGS